VILATRALAILTRLGLLAGILAMVLGAVLCENALRIAPQFRISPSAQSAQSVADHTAAGWEPVEIRAADGVTLSAWFFRPREANGDAVILMHGVGDTRRGVLPQAALFLKHGYSVLAPDSRGHGASGGDVITFGVRESDDVKRWTDWVVLREHPKKLFGLGESMGAAILLKSLDAGARFDAVVAECSFSTFHQIAYDRLASVLGLNSRVGHLLLSALIEPAFLYARLRYGVDLRSASPLDAVRATNTPILLIHGTRDENIAPRHSRILHNANRSVTELWEVPGAFHTAAMSADPISYERRVTAWFSARSSVPQISNALRSSP
jgi:alpha-beta hydrolase superfamily lysophospholipase